MKSVSNNETVSLTLSICYFRISNLTNHLQTDSLGKVAGARDIVPIPKSQNTHLTE